MKSNLMRSLCIMLAVFSALTMPATGSAEEKFTDPMNYFSLPLPEGWNLLTIQLFGERQYMFSPEPLSLEQLMKGYDLDASFIFKVYALSDNKREMTMDEILENNIEYRTKVYGEHGIVLKTSPAGPGKAAGLKGVTANISQPEEKEFLFLGRKESRFYEVHYSYKKDKEKQYLPLLKAMYEGIKLNDNSFKKGTKEFKDEKKTFSMSLPVKWHISERDDGKTAQIFISREKVVKDEDRFEVGLSITKIRRFSKSFKVPINSDSDIVKTWFGALEKNSRKEGNMIFAVQKIKVDEKEGILIEESLRAPGTNIYVQMYRLILAKNDTLYEIVLEAPVLEFDVFKDMYMDAIKTLRIE